jgi:hypothetical protein
MDIIESASGHTEDRNGWLWPWEMGRDIGVNTGNWEKSGMNLQKKKQIIVRAKSTSVIITHRGVILIVSPKNPSA